MTKFSLGLAALAFAAFGTLAANAAPSNPINQGYERSAKDCVSDTNLPCRDGSEHFILSQNSSDANDPPLVGHGDGARANTAGVHVN